MERVAYLLHDTSLTLGEGDVATRLVLDELDLDLASLTTLTLVIVVVVVASGGHSSALGTASFGAVAGREVILRRRRIIVTNGTQTILS